MALGAPRGDRLITQEDFMKTDGKHEKRRGNETGQPQPQQRPGQGGQPGQQWPGKVSQPATKPATTWPGQPGQPDESR